MLTVGKHVLIFMKLIADSEWSVVPACVLMALITDWTYAKHDFTISSFGWSNVTHRFHSYDGLYNSFMVYACSRPLLFKPTTTTHPIHPYTHTLQLAMSDYYWPKSFPTALHINYITQVRYTIHVATRKYFQVKQTNIHDNMTLHRVYLP